MLTRGRSPEPTPSDLAASKRTRIRIGTALALALIAWLPTAAFAQKTELLVYTALETDQLRAYSEAFARQQPDIELRFVRDSTGVITAKLLAEKGSPQADVVLGVAASSLEILEAEGLLAPYEPRGFADLDPALSDTARPPVWVGMDVWAATVCYNTIEGKRLGIPRPASWIDLTRPAYRGQVVMPNPVSSGTGYLDVTAWLQIFGASGGWAYMNALHANIAQYTHSGSKPCQMAASGEFVVGISFDYRANQLKKRGAPIDLVFPREGLGWDIEAAAIMRATQKPEAARRLLDWVASREANQEYARNFARVAMPGVATRLEYIPENFDQQLVKNDFAFAARYRGRLLAEWQARFEAKSEPK